MDEIDWSRMAVPQDDGYDTDVLLHMATTGPSLLRPQRYRRRPVGEDPSLFDGQVAVRNPPTGGLTEPKYAPASPSHPHLKQAEALLKTWPAVARQFARLVDTVQPWTDTSASPEYWLMVPGSSSHSEEAEFGTIMVTIGSPIALAQAMVHEMAHHKLRALGISLLKASHLVINDPTQLHRSPIITNKRRPMTAVLHAQYSFIHVTALEIAIYEHDETSDEEKDRAIHLLARNVPRMEAGQEEIEAHIRTDADGAMFVGAFMTWSGHVLAKGRAILDAHGYGIPPL